MSDNLSLWNKLGKTDPAHTKPFTRGGGFKGTAIKPIYTELKMTEMFGPCGTGWGMGEPHFQLVEANNETLVYCTVNLWYVVEQGKPPAHVWGVGGDKVVAVTRQGPRSDDEAFKKAFTDALGNAMKHLGMSADVHMGHFDGDKYSSYAQDDDSGPIMDYSPRPNSNGRQTTLERTGHKSAHQSRKDGDWPALQEGMRNASTPEQLKTWYAANKTTIDKLPVNWRDEFYAMYDGRMDELRQSERNMLAG